MSTTVVKVTTVGFTLSVRWSQGIWCGTNPPLITGLREAGEERMLDALVTPGAGRGGFFSGGENLSKDAGSTTTVHLEDHRVHEARLSVSEDKNFPDSYVDVKHEQKESSAYL